MLLHVPGLLTREQVDTCRRLMAQAEWVDGLSTAGAQAAQRKQNLQLPEGTPVIETLREMMVGALWKNPLFFSAALPKHILPPYFNRYENGGFYGNHIDNTIRYPHGTWQAVRTDVSTTIFLSDPEEYEGGELIAEDTYGCHEVKLAAGDAIVYPSTSLHRVEPVTKGVRIASFLWTQSLVRDPWKRAMLFELDMTILKLRSEQGDTPEVVTLTGHYHKLLQLWAE